MPKAKLLLISILSLIAFLFSSPVLASITTDFSLPSCVTTPIGPISYLKGDIISISIKATDSSGISSLTASAVNPSGTPPPFPAPLPNPVTDSTSITNEYRWNTSAIAIGDYNVTPIAKDMAGNLSTSSTCPSVIISVSSGVKPWLKTTGGDVHSNTRITAPEGP